MTCNAQSKVSSTSNIGRAQGEAGYTLIEMLLVMLLLGALVAIALPTFATQGNRAKDSDAQMKLSTAARVAQVASLDNNQRYPGKAETAQAIRDSEPTYTVNADVEDPADVTDEGTVYILKAQDRDLHLAVLAPSGKRWQLAIEDGGKPQLTSS